MFDSSPLAQRVLIYMHHISIPILENARQALPDATLTLMTPINQQELLWVDDIIIYDPQFNDPQHEIAVIEQLNQNFAAAIVFSEPYTPYCVAYMCYLAGIEIRIARSSEFGGGVLSHSMPIKDTQLDLIKLARDLLYATS